MCIVWGSVEAVCTKNPFEKDGFLDHRFHFLGKVVTALALHRVVTWVIMVFITQMYDYSRRNLFYEEVSNTRYNSQRVLRSKKNAIWKNNFSNFQRIFADIESKE